VTCGSLVVDGKDGFTALIDIICNKEHSIKTLTESDLERMVGEKYRNLRIRTGNVETAHALIVKNSFNDNICLVFSCFQMASTNHYAGIHSLAYSHEWMHCFNKLMGALNGEVLPELVNLYKSPFYLATRKYGAVILTKKLHSKGVLPKDVIFFALCQVGGIKGCEAVLDFLEVEGLTREEASSKLGRRGYDGSLDSLVTQGYSIEEVPSKKGHQARNGTPGLPRGTGIYGGGGSSIQVWSSWSCRHSSLPQGPGIYEGGGSSIRAWSSRLRR
jgi:hypothetical protein